MYLLFSSQHVVASMDTSEILYFVVDEIEYYVKKFGAGNFPFQDLTAIIKRDWIKTFCEELIKRELNINWQLPTGTRSEAIDNEIAFLIKKIWHDKYGLCTRIWIGRNEKVHKEKNENGPTF